MENKHIGVDDVEVTLDDIRQALISTGQIEPSAEEQITRCHENLLYGLFAHPQWLYGQLDMMIQYLCTNYAPSMTNSPSMNKTWDLLIKSVAIESKNDPYPFQFFFLYMLAHEEPFERVIREHCTETHVDIGKFCEKLRERTKNVKHTAFNAHTAERIIRSYVDGARIDFVVGEPAVRKETKLSSYNPHLRQELRKTTNAGCGDVYAVESHRKNVSLVSISSSSPNIPHYCLKKDQ